MKRDVSNIKPFNCLHTTASAFGIVVCDRIFCPNSNEAFLIFLSGNWGKVIRNWRQAGLPTSHQGTCTGN